MSCGPVSLTLAGIPYNHPYSLLLSILNQYQLQYGEYNAHPVNQLHNLNQIYSNYLQNNSLSSFLHGTLNTAAACFNIHLIIYSNNARHEYKMTTDIPNLPIMHLYFNCGGYDSVTNIEPRRLTNNPKPQTRINLRFATWNVRGAVDPHDRTLIDYQLTKLNIDVASIQEHTLHCLFKHKFDSLPPFAQINLFCALKFPSCTKILIKFRG